MIRSGKTAARTLLHARILLKADTDSGAPAWSDEAIGEALEVHSATVARARQRFVEEGLEVALRPRPSRREYARKLDGAVEAPVVLHVKHPPSSAESIDWEHRQIRALSIARMWSST